MNPSRKEKNQQGVLGEIKKGIEGNKKCACRAELVEAYSQSVFDKLRLTACFIMLNFSKYPSPWEQHLKFLSLLLQQTFQNSY